ncbi:MAG: metallophosphoesterase [Clostridia bacterium]
MNRKKEILLRFPILSDLHISGKDSEGSKKLKNLYNIIKSRGTCDLIMFAGDMTDFGLYEQIEEFADITTKNFDLNKTKLVFSVGNHELYNNELNHAPLTVGEDFKTAFKNKTFENASDFEIHHCLQHVVIKKIHFIGFNAYKYSGGVDFLQEDIEWLENAIDVAEDESEKNMPIFICAHPMIVGTCYGSDYGGKDGGYWASRRLYDILKKHPRVIYFAGHLHFPLQNEKSIWLDISGIILCCIR